MTLLCNRLFNGRTMIYQKYNNIQVIPNTKKIAELVLFNLQCFFNIIVTYKSAEYKFTGHDEIIRSCNIFQQFHSSKPCKWNDTSSGGKFKCDPKNRYKLIFSTLTLTGLKSVMNWGEGAHNSPPPPTSLALNMTFEA